MTLLQQMKQLADIENAAMRKRDQGVGMAYQSPMNKASRYYRTETRDKRMLAALDAGASVAEVAVSFDTSQRTVRRVMGERVV